MHYVNSSPATITPAKITVDDESALQLTVASNNTLAYLEWRIYGAKHLIAKHLALSALVKRDDGFTNCFVKLYDANGVGIVGGSTINIQASGNAATFTNIPGYNPAIPDPGDHIRVRLYVQNNSGAPTTVTVKAIQLSTEDAGPLVVSPFDVLSSFSGSVNCTPAAVVSLPYTMIAANYNVIVTPQFNGTAYVTKANGSFTITASGNGTVSYLIIPAACSLVM
jgi:hypothetical protein